MSVITAMPRIRRSSAPRSPSRGARVPAQNFHTITLRIKAMVLATIVSALAITALASGTAAAALPAATGAVPAGHRPALAGLPPRVHATDSQRGRHERARAVARAAVATYGGTFDSQMCLAGAIYAVPPKQLWSNPSTAAYWRLEVFKSTSTGWQPVVQSPWARGLGTPSGLNHWGTNQVGGYSASGWFWWTGQGYYDNVSAFQVIRLGPGTYAVVNHLQLPGFGVDYGDWGKFTSGSYYCYQ
jgi:hypothetical protein